MRLGVVSGRSCETSGMHQGSSEGIISGWMTVSPSFSIYSDCITIFKA